MKKFLGSFVTAFLFSMIFRARSRYSWACLALGSYSMTVMRRISAQYGTAGLPSYAISAVDNAIWDLKGKLLGRPVRWIEWRGQAADHPEVVQIPESSYLKGAILQAM